MLGSNHNHMQWIILKVGLNVCCVSWWKGLLRRYSVALQARCRRLETGARMEQPGPMTDLVFADIDTGFLMSCNGARQPFRSAEMISFVQQTDMLKIVCGSYSKRVSSKSVTHVFRLERLP